MALAQVDVMKRVSTDCPNVATYVDRFVTQNTEALDPDYRRGKRRWCILTEFIEVRRRPSHAHQRISTAAGRRAVIAPLPARRATPFTSTSRTESL
jgi:hypothetical protein